MLIFQRSTNHSTKCKSFNVVQIIQCSTNHSAWYKSFNAVQIIKCFTNHSTLYKSFNVVKIIQRNANHSTLHKSFHLQQASKHFMLISIDGLALINLGTLNIWLRQSPLFPYYLRFCHIGILKIFNTSLLYEDS